MRPTHTCLDGETLAAWVDGGLSRNDAAMAEAHVSSCPRCQEIAGLIVKTTPVTAMDVPWWRRRAAWLIPATVGVTAAGLLLIVPANQAPGPAAPPVTAAPTTTPFESAQKSATPAALPVAPPAETKLADTKPTERRPAETKKERQREERANIDVAAAPAATTAAAAAPPAGAPSGAPSGAAGGRVADEQLARQSFAKAAARQAVSPDGALHWRITDRGALERSTDAGTTWHAVNVGVTATFMSVQAPEPRTALVTTTDGRVFRTSDGGTTWRPGPP